MCQGTVEGPGNENDGKYGSDGSYDPDPVDEMYEMDGMDTDGRWA